MLEFTVFIVRILAVGALPVRYVKKIAEGHHFDDFENYLPKFDDVPISHYPANNFEDEDLFFRNEENNDKDRMQLSHYLENEVSTERVIEDVIIEDVTIEDATTQITEWSTLSTEIETLLPNVTETSNNNRHVEKTNLEVNFEELNETSRVPRQQSNVTKSDPEFESQEEGSSEEDNSMITTLITTFLGGLSRPDGGIDLDAIVGLLGSLSTQNADGSYDFQGLTDLLRGLLGGGGDEGGGSDIGAFVGGLLGALIKGVANPPGAKGAGILSGKILTGVLPALSGPPPPDVDMGMAEQPQGLDSGGFLAGLIKTILSSSGGGEAQGGGGSNLFQIIFSLITSVLSSSSSH